MDALLAMAWMAGDVWTSFYDKVKEVKDRTQQLLCHHHNNNNNNYYYYYYYYDVSVTFVTVWFSPLRLLKTGVSRDF